MSQSIEEILLSGANVPIYVSGSSMNPFLISRRDIVWLRLCESADLKPNAIVLFKRKDGSLVLHRIIKVLADSNISVKGDAQTWCETVDKKQIIGVVSDIERKGRKRAANSLYWIIINRIWHLLTPFRSIMMRIWFKVRRLRNER